MENIVTFLLNPLKNRRVWAVLMPDGELMDDIVSVKRAQTCMEEQEEFWLNPFGGAYHWDTEVSEPYEEEFIRFKKEAVQYMCIFNLTEADLQYIDVAPLSGELIFNEEELKKKLSPKELKEFKIFMNELWEY
ncbi:MAG: hypothetical protein GXO04_03600, partial [Aquificae bacterium]|nr:hypothetical protein [Aquificota bacterium]